MVLEPANIRSLLIRAWRERWSDIQWGIHIKTVLPRYISGDIYQLSDCLLQQALMGTLPNNLILSYLRHSLASQIVSFGGVIESISKYDGLNKPHCIHALLNLMQSMMKNVYCKGKPEDCLMLASSLVAGVNWLIQVIIFTTEKLIDLQTAPEHLANLNLATAVLEEVLQSSFFLCMVHIGCKEDPELFNEFNKKVSNLESQLRSVLPSVIENKEHILKVVLELKNSDPLSSVYQRTPYSTTKNVFCTPIYAMLTLEVVKFTTRDAKVFAHQLILLQKFKAISLTDLYFEILRGCFVGLSCAEFKVYQELKWVGFTFIKVPTIIFTIHTTVYGANAPSFSEELLSAITRLSTMVSLLDVADYKVNCNCLEYLLKEFIPRSQSQPNASASVGLISERDAHAVLAKRLKESNFLIKLSNNESQGSRPGNPDLILRAHPTVASILKTLSTKASDAVLPVLSLLISGKSRELLLVAAASSGNLQIYAQKFVKLNEQSKEAVFNETGSEKSPANRALVFDISFLLCCHIAQIYGIEVVVSESCNTFIEQWIKENIPETGKIKIPFLPSESLDSGGIAEILQRVNAKEDENKYVDSKYNSMCQKSTLALREVLCAAKQGQVVKQMILDLIRKFYYHMCSLPICLAAWLCSHIQQADQEEATLCLEILQFMQSTMVANETCTSGLDVFKDRSNMMAEIIKNMTQVIKGTSCYRSTTDTNFPFLSFSEDAFPLNEILDDFWKDVKSLHGQVSHKAIALAQDLHRLGGTKWFVTNFVKSTMEWIFENDLNEATEIVYGLFHMDILDCTLHHVIYVLPNYICGRLAVDMICEPRTSALARLTSRLLVACWDSLQPDSPTSVQLMGSTSGDMKAKHSILMRDMSYWLEKFNEQVIEVSINAKSSEEHFFLTSVHHLFVLIRQVTKTGVVSPVTHFIVFLLKDLLSLPNSSPILFLIPPSVISSLLPILSPTLSFDYPQLLALHEGSSPIPDTSRKDISQAAAKLLCIKRHFDLNDYHLNE